MGPLPQVVRQGPCCVAHGGFGVHYLRSHPPQLAGPLRHPTLEMDGMRLRTTETLLLLTLVSSPATAQDRPRLGFEYGTTRYGAIAHDNSSPTNKLSPHQPLKATVRFTTHMGPLGVGFSMARSWLDFESSNGTETSVIDRNQATIWEFSPELRFRVVQSAAGGRL
jgi:hypothetical protein